MIIFRFIAVVLIVLGLMLLGADVVTMLERGVEPHVRSLAEIFALFGGPATDAPGAGLGEVLPPSVAEGIAATMALPAFACFLGLGVVLAFLFRQTVEPE
jgi:hypothetical protein